MCPSIGREQFLESFKVGIEEVEQYIFNSVFLKLILFISFVSMLLRLDLLASLDSWRHSMDLLEMCFLVGETSHLVGFTTRSHPRDMALAGRLLLDNGSWVEGWSSTSERRPLKKSQIYGICVRERWGGGSTQVSILLNRLKWSIMLF